MSPPSSWSNKLIVRTFLSLRHCGLLLLFSFFIISLCFVLVMFLFCFVFFFLPNKVTPTWLYSDRNLFSWKQIHTDLNNHTSRAIKPKMPTLPPRCLCPTQWMIFGAWQSTTNAVRLSCWIRWTQMTRYVKQGLVKYFTSKYWFCCCLLPLVCYLGYSHCLTREGLRYKR